MTDVLLSGANLTYDEKRFILKEVEQLREQGLETLNHLIFHDVDSITDSEYPFVLLGGEKENEIIVERIE